MRLPDSYYNPISLIGSFLAGVSLSLIITFLLAMAIFGAASSYIGLFIYIVLPVFLVLGLILIPVGMLRRTRQLKKQDAPVFKKGLMIDLNNRKHRNALAIFVAGTFIFLFMTGIGSYEAFHYTESNEFCGLLCHRVMEPEYVAYQGSDHARVACVECHVGPGADWYVKSKLSGLYQVYSVTFNKFPQPIPTPVHSLRPARETCEKCHWPNKFYSYRINNEKHYLSDEMNSEWNIQLKMKTGSEHSSLGLAQGIHWHINPDIRIEYIASTPDRETIPWVRSINLATGDTIVYRDVIEPIDQESADTLEIRTMDCIDCHNRPSHQYLPPQKFIDARIASGEIPVVLPEIKRLSMELLSPMYSSKDSAGIIIGNSIREFYASMYPELADTSSQLIDRAIAGIMDGYSKIFSPISKASWDVYPDNIGHVEFNGCFRCHNGNHMDENENSISRNVSCAISIVLQGRPDNLLVASANGSLEFQHPVDVGEAWKEYSCTECHRHLY
ncbi:MAG: NapC/NirT family cytochrome c [Bacteroidales bacterium]